MRNFWRVVFALIWGLNGLGIYLLSIYPDTETRILIGAGMAVVSLIFLVGSISTTVGETRDINFTNF